jgi:hypothetical protein
MEATESTPHPTPGKDPPPASPTPNEQTSTEQADRNAQDTQVDGNLDERESNIESVDKDRKAMPPPPRRTSTNQNMARLQIIPPTSNISSSNRPLSADPELQLGTHSEGVGLGSSTLRGALGGGKVRTDRMISSLSLY